MRMLPGILNGHNIQPGNMQVKSNVYITATLFFLFQNLLLTSWFGYVSFGFYVHVTYLKQLPTHGFLRLAEVNQVCWVAKSHSPLHATDGLPKCYVNKTLICLSIHLWKKYWVGEMVVASGLLSFPKGTFGRFTAALNGSCIKENTFLCHTPLGFLPLLYHFEPAIFFS